MAQFGLKLMSELRSARELIDQAVTAEARDLAFVSISDHIHPWLPEHRHSPFAWSVLGAIADRTSRIDITTGVTCPIGRYDPVIVAQAAATVATLADGRFTLAVGAGERLNEHVSGRPFPPADLRHEQIAEAIDAIKRLWAGGFTTYRGNHVTVEDARIYDLPEVSTPLVLAVSGTGSLDLAERCEVDGIMATDPEPALVDGWVARGGAARQPGPKCRSRGHEDEAAGLDLAWDRMRFGAMGWKVMAELPNPVNFDAACEPIPALRDRRPGPPWA